MQVSGKHSVLFEKDVLILEILGMGIHRPLYQFYLNCHQLRVAFIEVELFGVTVVFEGLPYHYFYKANWLFFLINSN